MPARTDGGACIGRSSTVDMFLLSAVTTAPPNEEAASRVDTRTNRNCRDAVKCAQQDSLYKASPENFILLYFRFHVYVSMPWTAFPCHLLAWITHQPIMPARPSLCLASALCCDVQIFADRSMLSELCIQFHSRSSSHLESLRTKQGNVLSVVVATNATKVMSFKMFAMTCLNH